MSGISITDSSLFGNDIAEDEDEDIFFSYAIQKSEISRFIGNDKVLIATGLKGEGKSALLIMAEKDFKKDDNNIIIKAQCSSIAPRIDSEDQDFWVEEWKKSICTSIAEKIGETIGVIAFNDKEILKNIAIESGLKSQNIFTKIFSSVDFKLKAGLAGTSAEMAIASKPSQAPKNLIPVITRVLSETQRIYILIDDIDHNFENTKKNKAKISGLLTACRYLSNETPNIKFRLTLRDNVLSIVRKEYASMSHISQYIIPLKWTDSELCNMLAERIRSYIKRNEIGIHFDSDNLKTIDIVFATGEWAGESEASAVKPLSNLSQRRPRWFLELCKLSAHKASLVYHDKILFDDITGVSEQYGRKILDDMTVEYVCEHHYISKYFTAFMGQVNKFKFDDLIKVIKNRIVEGMPEPKVGPLDIAHFLFYIGFISARENFQNGIYKHYTYTQLPLLLTKDYPENAKFEWEIPTIFRNCLKMHPPKTKQNPLK
ncbi:hypothetical protein DSECCO2_204830 [anaerobic digester metagenome]